jgi:hypothetical protein
MSQEPLKAVVTFRSTAFNRSVPKSTFVNPECFGDDLAAWLISQLQARGLAVQEEPGAEDFGWYVRFHCDGKPYCVVVGYRPADGAGLGDWVLWLERDAGFLGSLLGRRNHGIRHEATQLLHEILSGADEIQNLRWHTKRDFDAGREEHASVTP